MLCQCQKTYRSDAFQSLLLSLRYTRKNKRRLQNGKSTRPAPQAQNNIENVILLAVQNAGLVIIQGYIVMLFDRLGLLNEDDFISKEKQQQAVLYLQYLATGQSNTEENYLMLNKVLCGIPLNEAVPASIEVSDAEKELMEGLLNAVISHWPSIGSSTIDGFRGNWLIRDGSLSEREDRWDLVVEKRPYDILLERSPYSFSIVKFGWMEKPLYVTWNY